MSGTSFPQALQILPKKFGVMDGLEYHVEVRSRFNSRQLAAFRKLLEAQLGTLFEVNVDNGSSVLVVRTTPADQLDDVEFKVVSTLRSILKPVVPHSALAFRLTRPTRLDWFLLGVKPIGTYEDAEVRLLHRTLRELPGVLESLPELSDNWVVKLKIEGNWREQALVFARKAADSGIAIHVHI